MIGYFLGDTGLRRSIYGAVAVLVCAGTVSWLSRLPATEPAEEITTGSIAPAAVAIPIPVPRPEIAPVAVAKIPSAPARAFVVHANRDIDGGDYATLKDVSQSVCETRCHLDGNCVAYTFNRWENVCFLKSSLSALRAEPRGISGILVSKTVAESRTPPTIQKIHARMLDGAPYETIRADYEVCATACRSDGRCVGFNVDRSAGACSLLADTPSSRRAQTSTAGLKLQPPPQRQQRIAGSSYPHRLPPEFALFDAIVRQMIR